MATDLENIATIKTNTLAKLAEISAVYKPTYSENGRQFGWTEYQKYLQDRVSWCDTQLGANDPFEIITYGIPDC